jgi:cell division protein FtsQ
MRKSYFWTIILFILLTTYKPKFNINSDSKLNIQKITIENNLILDSEEIIKKLHLLYNEKLFFLKIENIEKKLKRIGFIESFSIKKIYPNELKLIIVEKKPIAILHNKKEKFYISDKGSFIIFKNIEQYNNLPTVFGGRNAFFALYKDLENIKFPLVEIKSFSFFEIGRWDLITEDDKVIKLPAKDYLSILKNYMNIKKNINYDDYKIFDYRIKDQLILN